MASWNCATLLGTIPKDRISKNRRNKKLNMVVYLAKSYDILFLQEIHGNSADTIELQRLLPEFHIYTSYADNVAAGGVAIIMSPNITRRYPTIPSTTIIEPGRIIK
eukprot:6803950-Heterocapsa_arctica.AAC.1